MPVHRLKTVGDRSKVCSDGLKRGRGFTPHPYWERPAAGSIPIARAPLSRQRASGFGWALPWVPGTDQRTRASQEAKDDEDGSWENDGVGWCRCNRSRVIPAAQRFWSWVEPRGRIEGNRQKGRRHPGRRRIRRPCRPSDRRVFPGIGPAFLRRSPPEHRRNLTEPSSAPAA